MPTLFALLASIALGSTQFTLAYLSPQEVFPDLEVPEQVEQPAEKPLEASSSSSAGAPGFYRSGERIEVNTVPEPPATTPNVFETVSSSSQMSEVAAPETDITDEELLRQLEQEAADSLTEDQVEEPKPAAEPRSMLRVLLSQLPYLVGVILLSITGAVVLRLSKKTSTASPSVDGGNL